MKRHLHCVSLNFSNVYLYFEAYFEFSDSSCVKRSGFRVFGTVEGWMMFSLCAI